jgi:hypothetical protein
MSSKRFDKTHYDADDSAKYLVIDWLKRRNYDAYVNEDQFGVDVIAERGIQRYHIEVEVKHAWSGIRYPFPTLHYSARKIKFASLDVPTYFVTVNDERTHMLVVSARKILEAEIITKNTIYTNEEQFVSIPIAFARLRSLEN